MISLLEFLQARLTEDELTALAAVDGSPKWMSSLTFRDVKDEHGHFVIEADPRHPSLEQAAHIARHSPHRVLTDIDAIRDVIADYLSLDAIGELRERNAIEGVLRRFCAVHSDHPDYNPDWS
jgi:hypothetical protein